jgi:hypothetical protein
MWGKYTMEYYSAIKDEMMSFSGKWMKLEIIMWAKQRQAQKDKYCMFSSTCGI